MVLRKVDGASYAKLRVMFITQTKLILRYIMLRGVDGANYVYLYSDGVHAILIGCLLVPRKVDGANYANLRVNGERAILIRCFVVLRKAGTATYANLRANGGTRDFNWMNYGAAKGGHREICELAREWGADG